MMKVAPLVLLGWLGGCSVVDLVATQRRVSAVETKSAELEHGQATLAQRVELDERQRDSRLREIDARLSLALCSQRVQRVVANLRSECGAGPSGAAHMCTMTQVKNVVITDLDLDRGHQDRFMSAMVELRHEVVYLADYLGDVFKVRRERIKTLAQNPPLRAQTAFIIVASPAPTSARGKDGEKQAERRRDILIKVLKDYGVPEGQIHYWPFKFLVTREMLDREEDKPQPTETQDLNRGAWVFRADC